MSVQIITRTLSYKNFTFNAMAFIPSSNEEILPYWGLFTHGYTANKADCLSWAQRLSDSKMPCVIFDLPGHYLGSYNEVESFDEFKQSGHECFIAAFNFLQEVLEQKALPKKLILAGHSLGALLSLKAQNIQEFQNISMLSIGVGLGISQHTSTHLFETAFYQKTLDVRKQLVSKALDSNNVFPWIKEEKLKLNLNQRRIHLITGLDDVVVGAKGTQALCEQLQKSGNDVSMQEPKRLAHHEPSMAATHIYHFLKKELEL